MANNKRSKMAASRGKAINSFRCKFAPFRTPCHPQTPPFMPLFYSFTLLLHLARGRTVQRVRQRPKRRAPHERKRRANLKCPIVQFGEILSFLQSYLMFYWFLCLYFKAEVCREKVRCCYWGDEIEIRKRAIEFLFGCWNLVKLNRCYNVHLEFV